MQAIRANGVQNFSYNDKTEVQDPRNLIAMDMVRCMNCSKYYPLDQIHLHLRMHERERGYNYQQSRVPGEPLNGQVEPLGKIKPVSLEDQLGELSDTASTISRNHRFALIDIQTMAPADLPEPDRLRRAIPKPLPVSTISMGQATAVTEPLAGPSSLTERVGTNTSAKWGQSTMPETRPNTGDLLTGLDAPNINELLQHHEKEDYYEKVNISRTRVDINPKSIKVYSNQTHGDVDTHVDKPKVTHIRSPSGTANERHWTVVPIKEPGEADLQTERNSRVKLGESVDSSHHRPFAVADANVIPGGSRPTRINTTGKGKPALNRPVVNPADSRYVIEGREPHRATCGLGPCSWFKCGPSTAEPDTDNTVQIDTRINYSCSACGGFYCPVCKSTIPPQYRPPPGIKEYNQHAQEKHVQHGGTPSRQ